MLSIDIAVRLKQYGLSWTPQLHDFFALPETELADRVFVVSDMTIDVQKLFGNQLITFNGALEWSLDYVLTTDAVWVPTESQLRRMLQEYLLAEEQPTVEMASWLDHTRCKIRFRGQWLTFTAPDASDAYGKALEYVIKHLPLIGRDDTRAVA